MADLSKLREQIDQADQDLVKALVKRYDLVMEVGRVKRASGQAVFDPKREEQVLDKVTNLAQRPEYEVALRAVYQEIMDQAKRLEEDF
ncbi:chorismate mutase [Lactobacillus delbrueckii]|uniref:chorismate mutase n=1 Tax=Lactobacillus delbrueckii TaxID=1584 RepID=UPI003992F69B